MKKAFSIFLLSIYLITFTEVKEALKIPALIEHYKEHKSEKKETTIIGFIVLHYLSGNIKDADYEKDMKLPFKAHDFSCFTFVIQDLPKSFELTFSEKIFFEKKKQNFYYFLNFSEGKSFSFYPPPKFI